MNTLDEMLNEVEQIMRQVLSQMDEVSAESIGLDRRAGRMFYISEEAIAVHVDDKGFIDYYGGFEYIGSHDIQAAGEWVFYLAGNSRVDDCIERWLESKEGESEEQEEDNEE